METELCRWIEGFFSDWPFLQNVWNNTVLFDSDLDIMRTKGAETSRQNGYAGKGATFIPALHSGC